jgi:hypothetical protein
VTVARIWLRGVPNQFYVLSMPNGRSQ